MPMQKSQTQMCWDFRRIPKVRPKEKPAECSLEPDPYQAVNLPSERTGGGYAQMPERCLA